VAQSQLLDGTSSSLIGRVKQRDANAWNVLARLYGPLVYGWARQCGLQDQDAADIVQDVFQSVARAIDGFDDGRPGSTFRGWLWTITRNAVRQHVRGRERHPKAVGGTDAQQRMQALPQAVEEDQEPDPPAARTALVHRALRLIHDEFEPPTWQAFWRITVDGRAAAEVAEELRLTPGAVRQAKYRVLCRLREMLEGS
jgi:RNA polymerase sigma-70 factor (ECF subfamily)